MSRWIFVFLLTLAAMIAEPAWAEAGNPVRVEIYENLPAGKNLELPAGAPAAVYPEPAMALTSIPVKFGSAAAPVDRPSPFLAALRCSATLPPGRLLLRLRARNASRLLLDGKEIASTPAQKSNNTAHDQVPQAPPAEGSGIVPPAPAHREVLVEIRGDGKRHEFLLLLQIGGKGLAPSPGEVSVSAGAPGELPKLIGSPDAPALTYREWRNWMEDSAARTRRREQEARRQADRPVRLAWQKRHAAIREWLRSRPSGAGPASSGDGRAIDRLLDASMKKVGIRPRPALDDLQFLRRLSLDTIGLVPDAEMVREYLKDPPAHRRRLAVERLLRHPGWADQWVSYWQDVLAENPGILKPDLNNSGPFRWWLHQALLDNMPLDRMVTELVRMEGSSDLGAPAGFALAALNDAPLAAKGDILGKAFLGVNLSCARCHDAPAHPYEQKQLFSLSALLARKQVTIPPTSTVVVTAGFRAPHVKVTTRPGEPIAPEWPFKELVRETAFPLPLTGSDLKPDDSRNELAALMTAPENERFAQVAVNRIWARLMGRGIVNPVDDWHGELPSHPELLRMLGREFTASGYDMRYVARLILTSQAYSRMPAASAAEAETFAGPVRRRMTAEQLVDSLFRIAGKRMRSEPMNLSPLGDKDYKEFLDLGTPERSWQFAALSNERDRPSLALPIAQSIVDLLAAYGWRPSRQSPVSVRDDRPTPLQKLVLANGILGTRICRLSDDSAFTGLALEAKSPRELTRQLFLRILTREPSAAELRAFEQLLGPGFSSRVVQGAARRSGTEEPGYDSRVSWANHLSEEANAIRLEEERRLRLGDPPTAVLRAGYREKVEDAVWALVNSPEMMVTP